MKNLRMCVGEYCFVPGLVSTMITLPLLVLFVYLGFWQLSRYYNKTQTEITLQKRLNSPPLNLEALVTKPLDTLRFQKVTLVGEFLNKQQILLDNQIFQGQVGYLVFTPLQLKNTTCHRDSENDQTPHVPECQQFLEDLILVNRGWIPAEADRAELPFLNPIEGSVTITGILDFPKSGGLQLGSEEKFEMPEFWPIRVQRINLSLLAKTLKRPLLPMIVILTEETLHHFKIEPLHFGLPANRHLGYALQWFTMAIALFIYYFVINFQRKNHDTRFYPEL